MRDVHTVKGTVFQLAVPDVEDWAKIRHTYDDQLGNCYSVHLPGREEPIGRLRYILDFPASGLVNISDLWVDPEYRQKGVGMSLIGRLHAAHPDHKVDPGFPRDLDYVRHILESEPQVPIAIWLHPDVRGQLDQEAT